MCSDNSRIKTPFYQLQVSLTKYYDAYGSLFSMSCCFLTFSIQTEEELQAKAQGQAA